jgi:hypothetical protein
METKLTTQYENLEEKKLTQDVRSENHDYIDCNWDFSNSDFIHWCKMEYSTDISIEKNLLNIEVNRNIAVDQKFRYFGDNVHVRVMGEIDSKQYVLHVYDYLKLIDSPNYKAQVDLSKFTSNSQPIKVWLEAIPKSFKYGESKAITTHGELVWQLDYNNPNQ